MLSKYRPFASNVNKRILAEGLSIQVKKMLLMQQGDYTANNKILILLNRICLSMCIVVLVLVVRISIVVKGQSSHD